MCLIGVVEVGDEVAIAVVFLECRLFDGAVDGSSTDTYCRRQCAECHTARQKNNSNHNDDNSRSNGRLIFYLLC
jgi:hypothetical protein